MAAVDACGSRVGGCESRPATSVPPMTGAAPTLPPPKARMARMAAATRRTDCPRFQTHATITVPPSPGALPPEGAARGQNPAPGGKRVMTEHDGRPARRRLGEHPAARRAVRYRIAVGGHPTRVFNLTRVMDKVAHVIEALPGGA